MRIELGATQEQLAEVTGLSVSTIRRLERGELENPPITYLINCARALDVELEELIEPEWAWSVFDARAAEPPEEGWPMRPWRAGI